MIKLDDRRYGRLLVLRRSCDAGRPRWVCRCDCGRTRVILGESLRNGSTTSCGCFRREYLKSRTGKSVGNWKGGRTITSKGYVGVRVDGRYILEHRQVMERRLGRALLPTEEAHHKNGIRHDNRDDNLELWVKGHAPGQRVKDLLEWAEEFVRTYGPLKQFLE